MIEPEDDRIICRWCAWCHGSNCAALKITTLPDLPRRCEHYRPNDSEADQRTGRQRWPTLNLQARR